MTTQSSTTPSEEITAEVASWEGVSAGPGKRGEFAFKLGRREIGHLHGDHAAHFFFPRDTWRELREEGRIGPHPVFPDREGAGGAADRGRGRRARGDRPDAPQLRGSARPRHRLTRAS